MDMFMARESRKMAQYSQEVSQIPVLNKPVSDKRKAHRHTLTLETEVHFVEQEVLGMFRCHTQNIGLNGAFLPSGVLPVESSMLVEVVFKSVINPRVARHHREYRLQAQVVHSSEVGAGLEFKMLDREHMKDFRRFLFKAKVAARH